MTRFICSIGVLLLLITYQHICHVSAESDYDSPPPSSTSYQPTPPVKTLEKLDGSALVFPTVTSSSAHEPVVLTSANFFDLVLDSRQPWMVAFVAPWCGHCKALHAPWKAASRSLLSTVRLGIVDSTVEKELAGQFKIAAYPTILAFPGGKKTPKTIAKYEGGREAEAITFYARNMLNMKSMKLITGSHERFPDNVLSFFHGSAAKQFSASNLPSLLVFLHTAKPSDELKAISQSFENRLNFGVVNKDDQKLRQLFRIKSTPSYFVCLPARWTRTNETGTIDCVLYDHASKSGGGTSVPAVSDYLVKFIHAIETNDLPAVKRQYRFKRIILDSTKASSSEGSQLNGDESSSTSSVAVTFPFLTKATQFQSDCIDTKLGVCLLIFTELPVASTSTSHPTTEFQRIHTFIRLLLTAIHEWNNHVKRASSQVSPLLVATSSLFTGRMIETFSGVVFDTNESGVTIIALLPSRNRYVQFHMPVLTPAQVDRSEPLTTVVADAMDWLERIRDDPKIQFEKTTDLKRDLANLIVSAAATADQTAQVEPIFTSTLAARHSHEAAAHAHDDEL